MLYPGLCAFALTARQLPTLTSELGYSIFAHQIGHPNKNRSRQQDFILLPTSVGMTGLEPATSRPPDACANQLRYIPCLHLSGCKSTYFFRYMQTFAPLFCFFIEKNCFSSHSPIENRWKNGFSQHFLQSFQCLVDDGSGCADIHAHESLAALTEHLTVVERQTGLVHKQTDQLVVVELQVAAVEPYQE